MYEYMYDESIQIDNSIQLKTDASKASSNINKFSRRKRRVENKRSLPFSDDDYAIESNHANRGENCDHLYLSDYNPRDIKRMSSSHEQGGIGDDDDGQNPNGQVYQEKFERPITRVGTRQKTTTGSGQQPPAPSGRPGTGRHTASTSRPRAPSPEPSEAADPQSDDDDGEYEDQDVNMSPMEGFGHRKGRHNLLYEVDSEDDSIDESIADLFKMVDSTNMSAAEFSDMLRKFPDHAELLSEPEPHPEFPEPIFREDKEIQDALVKKRWVELVLEEKRDGLRMEALCTRQPGVHGIRAGGMYNPDDYSNLSTTPDIKQLFEYISKYLPASSTTPEVKFKPFIREYEPSVGDIDAFLKVLHPDITNDGLGIKVLDEPSAFQSDPSVLDLRLRQMAKQSSAKSIVVKKVENAHKNPKIIDNWIKDISDLHRSKPSPSVHYSKPMPDIDLLLQEWPPEFEELLKNATAPSANLDCDLKTYVDLVCNMLDIPVYKSRIQSLHVLATLYLTHKNFNNMNYGSDPNRLPSTSNSFRLEDSNVDRMEL